MKRLGHMGRRKTRSRKDDVREPSRLGTPMEADLQRDAGRQAGLMVRERADLGRSRLPQQQGHREALGSVHPKNFFLKKIL